MKITGGNSDFIFPLSSGASRVSQHGNDLDTDRPLFRDQTDDLNHVAAE